MKAFTKNSLKIAAVLALVTTGCAKSDTAATQHQIAVQFGSYTTAKNPLLKFFMPEAKAAVSSLKMCFKRLRFKTATDIATADPLADSDNIDFNLGEKDIASGSTALGVITLPAGDYVRVEFDLENTCAGGKSISLVNGAGTFSSTERITIKFEGNFTANVDGTLTLGVQQILTALNNYTTGSLRAAAESASGALANQ